MKKVQMVSIKINKINLTAKWLEIINKIRELDKLKI